VTVSTIRRRLAAITYAHRHAGYDSPGTARKHFAVREVLAGIRRTLGVAQQGAEPLLGDAIQRIAAACPTSLLGLRDRALVLLGFSAASRRGELASILEVQDLTFADQGLYILLRRSKTDQEQVGRTVAIPFGKHPETCPVMAVRSWLRAAEISSGPALPRRRPSRPRLGACTLSALRGKNIEASCSACRDRLRARLAAWAPRWNALEW
jgi:hypothetical protein